MSRGHGASSLGTSRIRGSVRFDSFREDSSNNCRLVWLCLHAILGFVYGRI